MLYTPALPLPHFHIPLRLAPIVAYFSPSLSLHVVPRALPNFRADIVRFLALSFPCKLRCEAVSLTRVLQLGKPRSKCSAAFESVIDILVERFGREQLVRTAETHTATTFSRLTGKVTDSILLQDDGHWPFGRRHW